MEAWLLVGRLWSQCLCLQSPVASCFGAVHVVLYPVASPKMPEELRCRRYQAPSTSPISPTQPRTPPHWELIAIVFFSSQDSLIRDGWLSREVCWCFPSTLTLWRATTPTKTDLDRRGQQHSHAAFQFRFKTIQPRCAPNRVGKGQLGKWGHPADSAFSFDLLVS